MYEKLATPVMLSIKETAQHTGLSAYFIRNLVKVDKVKYVMAGKKTLINLESVIDYLNTGDTQTNKQGININNIRKVGA